MYGIVLTFVLKFPVFIYRRKECFSMLFISNLNVMYGVHVVMRAISSSFVGQLFSVIICMTV